MGPEYEIRLRSQVYLAHDRLQELGQIVGFTDTGHLMVLWRNVHVTYVPRRHLLLSTKEIDARRMERVGL